MIKKFAEDASTSIANGTLNLNETGQSARDASIKVMLRSVDYNQVPA